MTNRILCAICFCVALTTSLFADDNIVGFWKTIDEKTGKAQSLVAIYEYKGKFYGRMILTYHDNGTINDTIYDPDERAPGVEGNPYYVGMDFIWNLTKKGSKYTNGSVIDPQQGYVYGAEAWRDGHNLIMRGELLFIGRNQTWPPAKESDFPPGFKMPDTSSFVPVIPVPKDEA